ncbi:TIR domain-containing protein [Thermodesulfobacteriota bacterium]
MIKCFLAHSSSDKSLYVDIVADKLKKQNIVYDKITFEEGMGIMEEIEKGLSESCLFVLFISAPALESEYVMKELELAHDLHSGGAMKRIFPIIIDPEISYLDKRIPQWMRDDYNLKHIRRPTIAARRIEKRMREISWEFHPRIREKEAIFVGRNELIGEFEERIDSFDKATPISVIASGMERIGRKKLLEYCMKKSNVTPDSYRPVIINLNSRESLEDFIYKTYDLGFSKEMDLTNFLSKSMDEKTDVACKLIVDIQKAREILFVEDNRCIVTSERIISTWFEKILLRLEASEQLAIAVASLIRVNRSTTFGKDFVFVIEVPELQKTERKGLLKRYSDFEGLSLSTEDYGFMLNLLSGYPDQVYYAVDLVKNEGIKTAKDKSYLIVDFIKERVYRLISKYEENEIALGLLSLLSEFDFISLDLLFEIVGNDPKYKVLLDEFFATAICELLGANKEYLRLNDAVRDYLKRIRIKMPSEFVEKLELHLENFLMTYESEEKDISDFFYSMKQAMIKKKDINPAYLIPSHFVKTMKELYDSHTRYRDVVKLADRVLESEQFIDKNIRREIQYYLCLSLARERNKRFLNEVMKISGPDHNFLLGFYYRLTGRYKEALERLGRVLSQRPYFFRAKREMVQVYLLVEDYEKASKIAKQSYENDKSNPYHLQAYFNCLINNPSREEKEVLEELLDGFSRIKSEQADEMRLSAQAKFYAFVANDEEKAISTIDDAISKYPEVIYPIISKFEICDRFNRIKEMAEILEKLEGKLDQKSYFFSTAIRMKAILFAKTGKADEAITLIKEKLRNFPTESIEKLEKTILKLSQPQNKGLA